MGHRAKLLYRIRRSFYWNLPLACAAWIWRRMLFRTTFIAVTGSNGKSTTKNLLAAMLASRYSVLKTKGSDNGRCGILRTLLAVRPWHRFSVVEVGLSGPGQGWRAAALIRPDITIITGIGAEHTDGFPSLSVTASEKGKLVSTVGKSGFAVLNGDDPWCREIARWYSCRVLWFGTSPSCDLWCEEVSSAWPERMRMRVRSRTESVAVQTNFVGLQWATPVLAAMLAARECGIPLAGAADAARHVQPYTARMQPVGLPNGATLLRDEYNGSAGTTAAALQFLASVRGPRKIVVLSDITDDERPVSERLFELGKQAGSAAELVLFVGPCAADGVRGALAAGRTEAEAHAAGDLDEAAAWLRRNLAPGDLCLLKGRNADHFSRIYFLLLGSISCRKPTCEYRRLCDECPELGASANGAEFWESPS